MHLIVINITTADTDVMTDITGYDNYVSYKLNYRE